MYFKARRDDTVSARTLDFPVSALRALLSLEYSSGAVTAPAEVVSAHSGLEKLVPAMAVVQPKQSSPTEDS